MYNLLIVVFLFNFSFGSALASQPPMNCEQVLATTSYELAITELAEGQVRLANMKIEGEPKSLMRTFARGLELRYQELVQKVGQSTLDKKLGILYEQIRARDQGVIGQRQDSRRSRFDKEAVNFGAFRKTIVLSDQYPGILKAQLSHDQKRIILFFEDKIAILNSTTFALENWVLQQKFDDKDKIDIQFSRDGRYMVFRQNPQLDINLVELSTGQQRSVLRLEKAVKLARDIHFFLSPDSAKLIVHEMTRNRIDIVDLESGKKSAIRASNPTVSLVKISPDSQMLATLESYSKSNYIGLYDVQSGQRIKELKGEGINSTRWLQFSADGQSLMIHNYSKASANIFSTISLDSLQQQGWRKLFKKFIQPKPVPLDNSEFFGITLEQASQSPTDFLFTHWGRLFIYSFSEQVKTEVIDCDSGLAICVLSANDQILTYRNTNSIQDSNRIEIYDLRKKTRIDGFEGDHVVRAEPSNSGNLLIVCERNLNANTFIYSVYERFVDRSLLDE